MSTVTVPKSGRGPASQSTSTTLLAWLAPFRTSVGRKYLVALTGLALIGFVVAHLGGNLQLFAGLAGWEQGQEAINSYAKFLKDKGALLWVARLGLLGVFVLHLALALRLKWENQQARPVSYAYPDTIQATWASRSMASTGVVVGLFVLFHLAHFTLGRIEGVTIQPYVVDSTQPSGIRAVGKPIPVNYLDILDSKGRHNVYAMTVLGFQNGLISLLYIAAQIALFFHLSHGAASVFQTLGATGSRSYPVLYWFGLIVAGLIAIGNIAMPVACLVGILDAGDIYFPAGVSDAFPNGGVGR